MIFIVMECDWADENGRLCQNGSFGPAQPTIVTTRQAARAEGWTHRNGQDFCPAHRDAERG